VRLVTFLANRRPKQAGWMDSKNEGPAMNNPLVQPEVREAVARRRLKRAGWRVAKDRARVMTLDHQGGYQILDQDNRIAAGEHFDLGLDDLEHWADCFGGAEEARQ